MIVKQNKKIILMQIGAAVALFLIVFLTLRLCHVDLFHLKIDDMKQAVEAHGFWGPLIYIGFYQIRPFILIPSTPVKIIAGIVWGWTGLIYIVAAELICAAWQFLAARYFLHDWAQRLIGGRMEGIHVSVARNGFTSVLLVRLIPNIALDLQNLAFGLSRVKFGEYIIATFIGLLPGMIVLVYFGDSAVGVLSDPSYWWKIALAILLIVTGYGLKIYITKKKG
ncbi:MAG: VTT domain-containing protein [Candidatus Omnitrophica bacterium]|nr:VTT domain-containing protein [Candidatus Omnitrophota bacterium]MBU1996533.1 VTT domain-containing protein [Candidatus Omnitrophota bacterium]MBU4333981.1 VTT domain-containing protein [Candidatus Omnitrophota bacterium]